MTGDMDKTVVLLAMEKGAWLLDRQPAEFAQRCNAHRHLREASHKTTALLAFSAGGYSEDLDPPRHIP